MFIGEDGSSIELSHGALDARARAVAESLHGLSNERILLMYPPGLDYIVAFFGCLYAGAIAVPAYPPARPISAPGRHSARARAERRNDRLMGVWRDCEPAAVLSTESLMPTVKAVYGLRSDAAEVRWIATDRLEESMGSTWSRPDIDGGQIAFLQYTSGSTGSPKGVIIDHSNILHNLHVHHIEVQQRKRGVYTDEGAHEILVSWLPMYHDMGLISTVLFPIVYGAFSVQMSPVSFMKRPVRWLAAIGEYRGTMSAAPNFAYDECTRRVSDEDLESLDLSTWTAAFNAGEPVRPQTLASFFEKFARCGLHRETLRPAYGMAECTVCVSARPVRPDGPARDFEAAALPRGRAIPAQDAASSHALVSCGGQPQDLEIVIADPETARACPAGHEGEIWVRGGSVGQGYWRKPEASHATFGARLADSGEGPFLRTGDLGYLVDTELFVTGRIKDLIIIRGANHYPQEIEHTVEDAHPALGRAGGAAFSVEHEGEERLVVVQELAPRFKAILGERPGPGMIDGRFECAAPNAAIEGGLREVVEQVRRVVSEDHELELHELVLLGMGTVPKTSSGKIQRQACRRELEAGTLQIQARWSARPLAEGTGPETTQPTPAEDAPAHKTTDEVRAWLVTRMSEDLGVDPKQIDGGTSFSSYGLDSARTVALAGDLEVWLSRHVTPTLVFECPTIDAMAEHLGAGSGVDSATPAEPRPPAPDSEPIAIIGIGCRVPGASDAEQLWSLLLDEVDAIREVPSTRWDIDHLYDPDLRTRGSISTRWGGFVDDVDLFDAGLFEISPREVHYIDPQQRVLMEVTWQALEDAGVASSSLVATETGVFMGVCNYDYAVLQLGDLDRTHRYANTGVAPSLLANRISFFLGTHGPSMTIDTACSSSGVAIHAACGSLRRGESELAIAGGVNLLLIPTVSANASMQGMMAPDGRCKAFDARADGYVRGEGAVVVVLKPLSRALADGDRIYATILGGATTHDGRSNGLTAPNPHAQHKLIRAACRDADIEPTELDYVEAHGTGTSLGDSVEARALAKAVRPGAQDRPCVIGSIKSNIGHLEGAAGAAGLAKVALALAHRQIPASLHFETPNPDIDFAGLHLEVCDALRAWPPSSTPTAGVSSFGVGGTNSHLVLRAAPPPTVSPDADDSLERPWLLPLSAHTPQGLQDLMERYAERLDAPGPGLGPVARAAARRRSHHPYRAAFVGRDADECREHLRRVQGEAIPGRSAPGTIVFVFPGQGSQWLGMGRGLLQRESVFAEAIERCESALGRFVDWSLHAQLHTDDPRAWEGRIDIIQPTLFAIEVALAELWRSWGIEPDAVVGHSMGEVAAAVVAGGLSLDDGASIICQRSLALRGLAGQGAMLAAQLDEPAARRRVEQLGDAGLALAAVNGPTSVVFSGRRESLEVLAQDLGREEIFHQFVDVDVASHGPQVDPLEPVLLRCLTGLEPTEPRVRMLSTVRPGPARLDASYWVDNLRQPVAFWPAIAALAEQPSTIFIEVSPHPVLGPAIAEALGGRRDPCLVLPSLRRETDELTALLGSLGRLYEAGVEVRWPGVYPGPVAHVALPALPLVRQRFELDLEPRSGHAMLGRAHSLLGVGLRLAAPGGVQVWQRELGPSTSGILADHRVDGACVFPGTGHVQLALCAAREHLGPEGALQVDDLKLVDVLACPDEHVVRTQIRLAARGPGEVSYQMYGVPAGRGGESADEAWVEHAHARVSRRETSEIEPVPALDVDEILDRCDEIIEGDEHYRRLRDHGIDYGHRYRAVDRIWRGRGEALGRLKLTEALVREARCHPPHPAILDAACQLAQATIELDPAELALPQSIEHVVVYGDLATAAWTHCASAGSDDDPSSVRRDVRVLDTEGRILASLTGFVVRKVGSRARARGAGVDALLHHVVWRADPIAATEPAKAEAGPVLLLEDERGLGAALATRLEAMGLACLRVRIGSSSHVDGERRWVIDPSHPEQFDRFLSEAATCMGRTPAAIVSMWSLDAPSLDEDPAGGLAGLRDTHGLVPLVQALVRRGWRSPPRLWVTTAGAHGLGSDRDVHPLQAAAWGITRAMIHEHPELRCTGVDLSATPDPRELDALARELGRDGTEDQLAFRGDERYVARLGRFAPSSSLLVDPTRRPVALSLASPGVIDDLVLQLAERREPARGEVELQIHAAGLNFRDVLKALGTYPADGGGPLVFGDECAGTVTAVGDGVEGIEVGQRVLAMAPGCIASFVTCPASRVWPVPAELSLEQAASIPVAFTTAWFALHDLGRMRAGDRVLIHAAAGGVGLAAVQLAQAAGATIFATAGSEAKREHLRSLGIDHVMDSRSFDFVDRIFEATQGEGVHLVLNSLGDEVARRSMSLVAQGGHFLELGRRPAGAEPRPLGRNFAVSWVEMDSVWRDRPGVLTALIERITGALERGEIQPLPTQTFALGAVREAFSHMARARHTGKIVLSIGPEPTAVEPGTRARTSLPPDGAYLVTGGLGGLGRTTIEWMVERGARDIVVMTRKERSAAEPWVERLRARGVRVDVVAADVSRLADVQGVVASLGDRPLRGVVHAAGVLDDATLARLDRAQLDRVMAPKCDGAWNLHRATQGCSLECFIVFSSVASMLGSPGQANYCAANAFADALVRSRRAQGQPGLSLAWGPWAEVGLAAGSAERGARLGARGIRSLTPPEGLAALDRLWDAQAPVVAVLPLDVEQWSQFYPSIAGAPLLADLVELTPSATSSLGHEWIDRLDEVAAHERLSRLTTLLRVELASVLQGRADALDEHAPFRSMGVDSLMSVELRNRIEARVGIRLVPTVAFKYPSLARLAAHLLQQIEPVPESTPDAAQ